MNILYVNKVEWYSVETLSFTLSNGEYCTAGSQKVIKSHKFDPNKKITKVECIFEKTGYGFLQINFYSGQETLVQVGASDDRVIKRYGGRVEIFEIEDDEQLDANLCLSLIIAIILPVLLGSNGNAHSCLEFTRS